MRLVVLGATGSIGRQTLDVVRSCLKDFTVTALTGFSDIRGLSRLANEFRPLVVCVGDSAAALELKKMLNYSCEILTGAEGLIACAVAGDIVVNALVGRVGLGPTLAAINAGCDVALANKETLVTAGGLVMALAREKNVRITPIDSEHSAIWQCLQGNDTHSVEKIILTASGGAFRTRSIEEIAVSTAEDALRHPNWNMGVKITIDCATLMNKGLELIETMWLFDQPMEKIEVLIHPQSIIHSMVQFKDGAIMAQMGLPDMRLPILYALSAPRRIENNFPRLDFKTCLTFEDIDLKKFPCFSLACEAAKTGGTLPAVMNYINEWAVNEFLQGKINFYGISDIIAQAFEAYNVKNVIDINDIYEAENWAFEYLEKR